MRYLLEWVGVLVVVSLVDDAPRAVWALLRSKLGDNAGGWRPFIWAMSPACTPRASGKKD